MTGKSSLFCGRLSFNHQIQSKKQLSLKSWGIVAVVAMMFVLLFSSTLAVGQSVSSGTVVGTINDPSGAVVPGADITMTDHTTNATIKATSNQDGHFAFANVAPSTYDIKITKSGFETALIREQQVQIGQTLTESVTLTVGSVTQEVTVQTTGTELQTLNATVGNTVTGVALDSLPAIGGDVTTFMELQPGVSPGGYVGGENSDQSTFQLDGGNNTSDMDGNMTVYTPSYGGDPTGGIGAGNGLRGGASGSGVPTGVMPTPSDSIEEFKVNTANQTADFNSSSGAQLQMVTKRGTNAIHGTVYEYYLDNNFNANSWQNNLTGVPLPSYHYSRFGAAAGGPLIPKNILGGKTYIFGMYQGFRWPNSATDEVSVPTQNMRNGLISFDGGKTFTPLAPNDPRGATDAGSGINPTIQAFWNKYLPLPNDPSCGALSSTFCDGVNVQGYRGNIAIPQSDNFGVVRIDHDFGAKWHLNASYHYYHLHRTTVDQTDIGGFFAGDTLGTFSSLSNRPQVPWYYAAGLTTNISSNVTNDVHYSFLRNWWAWNTNGAPPQIPGLQQAIEPMGEQQTSTFAPFNVNAQQTRTRFWDGMDHYVRDDLTMLHGNHLFTFGGAYQHDYDYHQRTDNGAGINYTPTDLLGDGSGAGVLTSTSALAGFYPAGVTESQPLDRYIAATLGMVTDSQVALTRTGANLALNAPLTPAFDQSTIPYYNFYFSDSWHLKPTVTFTYGLGYTLELPPTETNGKQVLLVNSADEPISIQDYLDQRARSFSQGQIYNPQIGFALVGNTANAPKYPYLPFYGEFSPRVAIAWNPHFSNDWMSKIFGADSSVIRAGYGRIYGRLNGVNQVLVPLLGPGLIQAAQCTQVLSTGSCGPTNPTAATVYRIGVDGLNAPIGAAAPTLPQPVFPGFSVAGGIPIKAAAEGSALDPHTRPSSVDSVDFTIQRQLSNRVTMEVGYIGRYIHNEFAPVDINAVPYMMTNGGQSFENAYANLEVSLNCEVSVSACGAAIPPATIKVGGVTTVNPAYEAFVNALPQQAFFTSSLNSSFCGGSYGSPGSAAAKAAGGMAYPNCTAALVDQQLSNLKNQAVWNIWTGLDNGGTKAGFNFGCTMLSCAAFGTNNSAQLVNDFQVNSSIGYGNYNAGFVTLKMNDFHNVTLQQNLTYGKALGLGDVAQSTSSYTLNDPFNLNEDYGLQSWDRKFIYNMFMVYQEPYFKSQQGLLGHLLGGWNWSPIFTAGSGAPLYCTTKSGNQSFGSNSGNAYGDYETCGFTGSLGSYGTANYGVNGGVDPNNSTVNVGTNVAKCVNAACGKGGVAVPINFFSNPVASYSQIVDPILGLTQTDGGEGPIRGLPYWNVDMSIRKNIKLTERFSAQFQAMFLNVFNHMDFANPSFNTQSLTSFGTLKTQGNTPRQMEFGLRVNF